MTADRPIAMSSRPRLYQYENDVAIPLRSLISSAAEKANMRMAETRTPWRTGVPPLPWMKNTGVRLAYAAAETAATVTTVAVTAAARRTCAPGNWCWGRGRTKIPARWQAAAIQANVLCAVTPAFRSTGTRKVATRPVNAQKMAPQVSHSRPASPRAT